MNKNDVTDEILVALADDELPGTEAIEIHSIVMEHEDLMQRYSSFVETRFLLQADAKKNIELSSEMEGFLDEQFGLDATPNILSFPPRKTGQPTTRVRQLMQMAAALGIGVMLGPIATMTGVMVEPTLLPVVRSMPAKSIELVIVSSHGGTFSTGDTFDLSKPFKVKVASSIKTEFSIFQMEQDGTFKPWPDQKVRLGSGEVYETILYNLEPQTEPLVLKLKFTTGKYKIADKFYVFGDTLR
jgi:hypothetical protein